MRKNLRQAAPDVSEGPRQVTLKSRAPIASRCIPSIGEDFIRLVGAELGEGAGR
jgi:hypothetical protein